MNETLHKITLARQQIEYSVKRSQKATQPRIDVDIRGVRVVLPEQSSLNPRELLRENADWVLGKKRKFVQYRQQAPQRQFIVGEQLPYLGQPHTITISQNPQSNIKAQKFQLAQDTVVNSSIREALKELYIKQARQYLSARIQAYAQKMGQHPQKIEIRNQRTRWASCSPIETLSFNWRLMMAPPPVIDYVVVHEIAHLEERKHNKRFWRLVQQHIPDYHRRIRWLKDNSSRLIFDRRDL